MTKARRLNRRQQAAVASGTSTISDGNRQYQQQPQSQEHKQEQMHQNNNEQQSNDEQHQQRQQQQVTAFNSHDIVNHFVHRFLAPQNANKLAKTSNNSPELESIVETLEKLAVQFQLFCHQQQQKQVFDKAVACLNVDDIAQAKERFQVISDELFINGTQWAHILTFLVLSAELACLVDSNKVSQVVQMAASYIDERLVDWIENVGGGWSKVSELLNDVHEKVDENKGLKKYYGFAALAALVGIYFCARLGLQS